MTAQRFNHVLKRRIDRALALFAKAPVRISLGVVFLAMIIGGTIFSLAEPNASLWDGVYWTWVVMPTVGFGDYSPETIIGRWDYIYVVASGWLATILLGGAVAGAVVEHDIHLDHEETPEIDDDLAVLSSRLHSTADDLVRLQNMASHPLVRDALRKAHEEGRNA